MGAWPVPWAAYGRLGVVAGLMGNVWSPWGRGRSPAPRMATAKAWPFHMASYGRREGVAGPLNPLWPPWGRGRSHGPRKAAVGGGRSPANCVAAVGAWPVPWAP